MDKHFKKFYEVGNNRYYTLASNNDLYIATECFVNVARRFYEIWKPKTLTQSMRMMQMSTPIVILFNELTKITKIKGQRGVHEDDLKYTLVDNKKVKSLIFNAYDQVMNIDRNKLKEHYEGWLKSINTTNKQKVKELKSMYKDKYEKALIELDKQHPLNTSLSIDTPSIIYNAVLAKLFAEGKEHLYTEKLNSFANEVYLYEQDCFATLTIYKLVVIKGIVKSIDTFIYNKKVVDELLSSIYVKNVKVSFNDKIKKLLSVMNDIINKKEGK